MRLLTTVPYFTWLLLCLTLGLETHAQQKDVNSEKAVWEAAFVSFRTTDNYSIYTDLHHINGAFTVVRLGLTRHLPYQVNATAGYSFAWLTVPGSGSDALKRHEHRPWLQFLVPNRISKNLSISTRLRYDMRIKQRVEVGQLRSAFDLDHRLRLQEIIHINLPGLRFEEFLPYLALSDEIMLNFGENISHNTFDQNRLGMMVGFERKNIRLQTGYMNRFVQSGSVPNRYTNNHNYTIWLFYKLDLRKQQEKQE